MSKNSFSWTGSARRATRAQAQLRRLQLECLENRLAPTISNAFDLLQGTLACIGDGQADVIAISADAQRRLLLNGNLLSGLPIVPTLLNTHAIVVVGGGGADAVTVDLSAGLFVDAVGQEVQINVDLSASTGGVLTILGQDGANDNIVSTGAAIDLNGDGDADLTINGDVDLTIDGQGGDDNVVGTPGDDNLQGGAGNDTVSGGQGNDTIDGGGGDDWINGDQDNDTLSGDEGNDVVQGQQGDDALDGGAGHDQVSGGDGNDSLTGGLGDDTIDGGPGFDQLVETGDVDFVLRDNSLSGLGNDVLRGLEGATLTGGDGKNTLDASGFTLGAVTLSGLGGDDTLIGTKLSDLLFGGDGNDRCLGRKGHDLLDGGTGNDQLNGGKGRDDLRGGAGADTLEGDRGRDTLAGGDDNDFLDGGRGSDTMDGGNGSDILLVEPEKDTWTNGEDIRT